MRGVEQAGISQEVSKTVVRKTDNRGRVLEYDSSKKFPRIYLITTDENGAETRTYLPHESLDEGIRLQRETFLPLDKKTLNFVVGAVQRSNR